MAEGERPGLGDFDESIETVSDPELKERQRGFIAHLVRKSLGSARPGEEEEYERLVLIVTDDSLMRLESVGAKIPEIPELARKDYLDAINFFLLDDENNFDPGKLGKLAADRLRSQGHEISDEEEALIGEMARAKKVISYRIESGMTVSGFTERELVQSVADKFADSVEHGDRDISNMPITAEELIQAIPIKRKRKKKDKDPRDYKNWEECLETERQLIAIISREIAARLKAQVRYSDAGLTIGK